MNKMRKSILLLAAAVLVGVLAAGCTQPQEETIPEETIPEAGSLTYAEYEQLPVEIQQEYYAAFETPDDFFAWMETAQGKTQPTETVTETATETATEESLLEVSEGEVEDWE